MNDRVMRRVRGVVFLLFAVSVFATALKAWGVGGRQALDRAMPPHLYGPVV